MRLILTTPTLQAHSVLRYAQWRAVIAEHVALRLDLAPDDVLPRTVGHVSLALALTAYEAWLDDEDAHLARPPRRGPHRPARPPPLSVRLSCWPLDREQTLRRLLRISRGPAPARAGAVTCPLALDEVLHSAHYDANLGPALATTCLRAGRHLLK